VERALAGGAGLVIAESPTNPMLKVVDLAMLAELSHQAGALFAVDNTFATPYLQLPLERGADVAIYSATKYLGGHSDLVMGALVTSDAELATRLRFLQNSIGAVPSPFDSWLLLRGLKTLALRMRAHSLGAAKVAESLKGHPAVESVYFPGLPDFPGHDLATRQMAASGEPLYGGMVSIDVGSEDKALDLCARTKLFFLAESLGGVESLIEHPGKMTHASLEGSGLEISPGLVRLSVGIEHPDDLIADLEQALA
jgi:cystathionine gamma-synthase